MNRSTIAGFLAVLRARVVLLILAAALPGVACASWVDLDKQAQGQTVYFNAWGGDESTNAYIAWVADQVKRSAGIELKQVKVSDTAEAVQRIEAEKRAGRDSDGSVDLIWINGENFKRLKTEGLLYGPWAEQLPNWQYVDTRKPVRQDFSEPTDGLEAPWGEARLTLLADRSKVPTPPDSPQALLDFARKHPGRVTYPKPPDFHGTTFLKQLLLALAPEPQDMGKPVTRAALARNIPALWAYLDQLHPLLWREGKAFPSSAAQMTRMLADSELLLSITFNPNEGANLAYQKRVPPTIYGFGFKRGMIGNVHFLAIPYNAKAKAAAQVVANFMLSPQAQARKADPKMWGDATVLNVAALSPAEQAAFGKPASETQVITVPTLPEPDASWMKALDQAWLARYGSGK